MIYVYGWTAKYVLLVNRITNVCYTIKFTSAGAWMPINSQLIKKKIERNV